MNATTTATGKPSRRDYMRVNVQSADGTLVPESQWKELVTDIKPRAQTRALKRQGFVTTGVFDKAAYMAARATFRNTLRTERDMSKTHLIETAFQNAGVTKEPHLERATRDLLPILGAVTQKKALIVLKNVIRTVHNGIMSPDEHDGAQPVTTTSTVSPLL